MSAEPHTSANCQQPPTEEPPAQTEAGPVWTSGERAVWPRRAALLLIAALAGLSYAWAISQDALEYYYGSAVPG
jgi:hypothetical protein